MNAPEHKSYGNLSFEERSALKDLKSNVNLVIREADKGCSVVVMDRQRYIEEGYRQLNDTSVYLRTCANAINDIEEDIQRLADQLHIEGVITDDIRQFAIRRNTKPARFYLLPKVHKKGVPGRPLVSACGSATEGMSEIVDFFLHPYIPTIPSSIKDTDDFIRRIRNIIHLPSDVLLVTLDVVSLYPSIPHDFGLCALKNFLLDRNLPAIVVNGIHNMTEMVLKNNVIEFNSECFLQISCTAIGTKMASAYANIVMSIFERKLLTGSYNKPLVWFRYVDDIFAIYPTGRQCHTTRPVYFNVQFHPGLPDIKGILQRYMPLLHQSVTMKTVVPDLPLISFSQPHNLCRSLCRAKLRQAASVNDEPPRPSQSCGKSRCKLCLSLICYISSTTTIRPLNVITKILAATLNGLSMLFLVPSVIYNTWARVITLELA